MRKKMWTEVDFQGWMARCGLSSRQAAVVLGVTDMTVIRNRNGHTAVKDAVAVKAMEYVEQSQTTKGSEGELIDSYAAQIDLADLCEEFPLAVVTGFTSATMRGWTSANMGSFRQLRQPNRSPRPEKWDGLILDWYPTDPLELTSDVECRLDENGRPYRIASIERTLVDLVVAESGLTVDDIEESFAGAFASGGQTPDIGLVRTLAMKAGMLESLRSYLAPYI